LRNVADESLVGHRPFAHPLPAAWAVEGGSGWGLTGLRIVDRQLTSLRGREMVRIEGELRQTMALDL
jgi:hypothetical protein